MVDQPKPDPADLIDGHVQQNYRERAESGEDYGSMANEAERMNDPNLAAYLRAQGTPERKPQDRSAPPTGRTTNGKAQNAEGGRK